MGDATDAVTTVTLDHITLSNRARTNFVIVTLLFTGAIITCLLLFGDQKNSLHTSALAWAFTMFGGVVGAFIFGVSWDNSKVAAK